MSDKEYFSHLYEIASHLNQEYSLHSALRKALEKTGELLHLETGWIWLIDEEPRSVYLAASYNLPPALANYPERLSGWCFCLEKYFTNTIEQAMNISEITCSRLKNLTSGTRDLRFHATIPIFMEDRKVGLMNLLSGKSQRLNEKQLAILNTVSQLIGMAIRRTRQQEHEGKGSNSLQELTGRILMPRITEIEQSLGQVRKDYTRKGLSEHDLVTLQQQMTDLKEQLLLMIGESSENTKKDWQEKNIQYPHSALSRRELEVLELVKTGLTNKLIGERLNISERTVKFHMSSILTKLPASTRTEAVNVAISKGIL